MENNTFEVESGAVMRWIQDIIIPLNLCPFAKKPFLANQIKLTWVTSNKLATVAEEVLVACQQLDARKDIETTLVVFPESLKDFYHYLDALDLCQALLEEQGYGGIYQLASFHPDYLFEGEAPDDASHFTNRAPYPIIHIIREDSIDAVLKTYKDPESIPEKNIALMQKLGVEHLKKLFSDIHQN